MCLFYSSVLPLDIYILQQTVLTVPQQPVLPLDSSKSPAAYAACPWTRTGTAACAAFGRACLTAAVLPLDVYVLQQPVIPLDVPALQQPALTLDMSADCAVSERLCSTACSLCCL